jgi:hypothetical protein
VSVRWAFMETFEIPDLDRPERNYLRRLRVVQTPWFGVYLHKFDGPDSRPTLHDHPWNFVSIVLRGGYVERRAYDGRDHHVRRLNVKRGEGLHWIDRLTRTPSWTLMLVGRRRREWGYVDPDGSWTHFMAHRHSAEFDAAMAARSEATA